MITFTGILVLMLAYAALSLGIICLFWHLSKSDIKQRWQRSALWKGAYRLFAPLSRSRASRNVRMVDNYYTFGRAEILVAVMTAAVAFLAYRPDLGVGSIALSTAPYAPVSRSPSYPQDDGRSVNQLANFLARWTSMPKPSVNDE